MKLKVSVFLGSLFLAGFAAGAESYVIAKVTDMLGNVGYELMTRDEYAAAGKAVMEETKVFPKVIADCRKDWKEDEKRKGAFQAAKVKVRKISAVGTPYREKAKAQEKLDKLQEGVTEKRLAEIKEHSQKWRKMQERERAGEEEKLNAWRESFEMASKKMQEALGREIPNYGFDLIAPDPSKKH